MRVPKTLGDSLEALAGKWQENTGGWAQYFDYSGEALHYAWWHNNFGSPMSYGCVNLRLTTAKWFWDWATMGTVLHIH